MTKPIRWTILIGMLVCLFGGEAWASEDEFSKVFTDGVYGGLAGALVGGAMLAFKEDPGDHLNYLTYGAAIGVFVGTAFGLISASRSMAEIENSRIVFHPPIPQIMLDTSPAERHGVTFGLDLLTFRY